MKAGRELDALIAEKVMGIERCKHRPGMVWMDCGELGINEVDADKYSTDWGAAGLVVEKLRLLESYILMQCGDAWLIEKPAPFGGSLNIATADTAPLAICLASLKAIGVDINEKV